MPDVGEKPDRASASIGPVLCRFRCPPSHSAILPKHPSTLPGPAWPGAETIRRDVREPESIDIIMMSQARIGPSAQGQWAVGLSSVASYVGMWADACVARKPSARDLDILHKQP